MIDNEQIILKSHQDSVGLVLKIQDPQSVSPIFSPRRSVAFFQLVLLDLTDVIWSELPLYYIMEILPGLACVPLLRRKTQLC